MLRKALAVACACAVAQPLELDLDVSGVVRYLRFEAWWNLTEVARDAVKSFGIAGYAACHVERIGDALSRKVDELLVTNATARGELWHDWRVHFNRGAFRVPNKHLTVGTGSYEIAAEPSYNSSHGPPSGLLVRLNSKSGACEGVEVSIGKFCSIARGVEILACLDHDSTYASMYPFKQLFPELPTNIRSKGSVSIGNDVWIGARATILSGVSIGNGAVVGADAVVSRDVRPYAVVVGNPAREVKRRFDDATVANLLDLRWWDWPRPVLERHVARLQDADLAPLFDAFLRRPASACAGGRH